MVQRYLNQEKQMSYRSISHITERMNFLECKLQRQFAAKEYIYALWNKRRIISIDESSLGSTDCRKRGWIGKGKSCMKSNSQRLNGMSIIGAA